MSPVAVRPLRPGDVPALADLWVESWQATVPDIDFSARRDWFVARLAELAASGAHVLVAEAAGRLRGLVTIDPATGYLDQIAVAEDAKGRGVAGALLEAARRLSPGGIELDVNTENPRALRFYDKAGFVAVSTGVNAGGRPIVRLRWRPAVSAGPAAPRR